MKQNPPGSNVAMSAAGLALCVGGAFAGSYVPYVQPQCNPFSHFWRQRGRKQVCSVCHEVRGQANTTRRR